MKFQTPEGAKVRAVLEASIAGEKFEQAGLSLKMEVITKQLVEVTTFV